MNKKKTFCDILFGENSEEQQFEEFSSVEANIAQSIKDKYIDYCYRLDMIPKIKAECEKRNCYFAYEILRNEFGEIDYIKIIPVRSLMQNNKDQAFCGQAQLPLSYVPDYKFEKNAYKNERPRIIK